MTVRTDDRPADARPVRIGGLRTKIILRMAALALLLSVLLGAITYLVVRQLLVEDRRTIAVEQATGDARLVTAALRGDEANPSEVLAALRPPARSTPMLRRSGQWFAASLQVRPEDLPVVLVELVDDGTAAVHQTLVNQVPAIVVGVPLPDQAGTYFEVFSLADVDRTLSTLLRTLALAGAIATAAGVLLGRWMARRVLRPLREVTSVARLIADGELGTRLDERLDDDLTVLSNAFNRMAETLQGRIAREARFASDVAHELRTPLTSVVTSLAVIESRRAELSPQSSEALDILSGDVQRLQNTVADLTEIAQHDAGVVSVQMEVVPVAAVVASLLNRFRRENIALDIDTRASRALVTIDEHRLERVLANLIENADTHGGGATDVTVRMHADTVHIAVEDRGPGVPIGDRSRIFERFARGTDAVRTARPTGSGLGLALADENARLLGGRIWVEDRPGGGSRFVLALEASPG